MSDQSPTSFFNQNAVTYTDTNPAGPADTPVTDESSNAPSSFFKASTSNPSVTYLPGLIALAPVAHQFVTGVNDNGTWVTGQPSFADISGLISPTQVPPGAGLTGLSGPVAHEWVQYVDFSGVQHLAQPLFSDISGTVTYAQLAVAVQSVTFNRSAQIAAYTVVNGDKGNNIALGGAAFYTLTIASASGYDANFAVVVTNEDGGRAKLISASGLASFYLWPKQSVILYNSNNVWRVINQQRWRPAAAATLNVDPVNGLDTSDGLGALGTNGAFQTFTHALSVFDNLMDTGGQTTTIQGPTSGTITEVLSVSGAMPNGTSELTIQGNTGSPVSWQNTGTLFSVADYRSITFNGFAFSASSGSLIVAAPSQFALVDFFNCSFGNLGASGCVGAAGTNAKVNVLSGCSIASATMGIFGSATEGGIVTLSSLACSGTCAIGLMGSAGSGGRVDMTNLVFTGTTTGITGAKFQATNAGQIVGDSQVTWPSGFTAGNCYSGGMSDRMYLTPFDGASTFSRLPASPTTGVIAIVTDANVNQLGAVVSSGGGGNVVEVTYLNSAWHVSGIGSALSVANGDLAQMATLTIKGNNTGGTANPTDLTAPLAAAVISGGLTRSVVNSGVNPTGTTSLSPTFVMMGLGVTFTPKSTGAFILIAQASGANTVAGSGFKLRFRYGTGTPPTNGAAETGTQAGSAAIGSVVAAGGQASGNINAFVPSGTFAVGTTYWLDVSLCALVSGTASLSPINIWAIEI